MGWEGQETSLKPGEKAWSRTLPLWPEALAGHQPVSWGGVCPELILDSGSLSPGWEGGAHGCPLPGKGALLVIPVPPRMGDGGWGVEAPIPPPSDGFVLLTTHCSNPGYHTPSLS